MSNVRKITGEELQKMTPAERNEVFLKMVKIEGTGVVKRADGTIKYDNVTLKGTYGEKES